MRAKIVIQPELNFQPSNLKITNEYYKKYKTISKLLDENKKIINLVHKDIGCTLEAINCKRNGGRPFDYTTETVLRILLCQILEGLSLRGVVIRIDDSHFLRRFVRIYSGNMMDYTTLDKLKNVIRSSTWKKVNLELAEQMVSSQKLTGETLRLDTTAVETNIHWPTDSSLLWDSYRVLARVIEQAHKIDEKAVGKKRLRIKKAKKLYGQITRLAGCKTEKNKKKMKQIYKKLLDMVEGIVELAYLVEEELIKSLEQKKHETMVHYMIEALICEIQHFRPLVFQVINQTHRRVFEGKQVANDEKLFSLFEPHTELLIRNKQNKKIEFGHMIQIQQVRCKFITDYAVFEKKPNETQLIEPALTSHKKLFGHHPDCITADKGYYKNMETLEALKKDVAIVAIAKKGNRTQEQVEREHDPAFRDAQRFRAGVEGSISFLKRILGLSRCMNKAWKNYCSTVGITVFAHNLLICARFP